MKQKYVLGFLFNENMKHVVLIKKQKPDWQKNKYNGVGGKIDESDPSVQFAMQREFKEETSLLIQAHRWNFFCEMEAEDWHVSCFWAIAETLESVETVTEEEVAIVPITAVKNLDCIENIELLIKLAILNSQGGVFGKLQY